MTEALPQFSNARLPTSVTDAGMTIAVMLPEANARSPIDSSPSGSVSSLSGTLEKATLPMERSVDGSETFTALEVLRNV